MGAMRGLGEEVRTWTLVDGRSFEAALSDRVSFDGDVKLIDPQGKELSVPPERLSESDLEYIDIMRVPELDIDIMRSLRQVLYSSKLANYASMVRDPEIKASFGVRVKQLGSGDYDHELHVEFFVVGRQVYADCYMLLARETVSFRLTRENQKRFEYESPTEVPIRDFYMREFAHRGEKYHGYLVLVTDELGRVVAHEESCNWLLDNMENLKKIRVGNYFGQDCIRREAARPEPLIDLSF